MKFKKFGKALLLSALSAGVVLSVTSCVQSYTVGYLYVTGTATSQNNGNGIISGFKIDHNTGQLRAINGLPVASGGSNPVRALLLNSSRFIYVLNRGVNASGGSVCTTTDPCQNPNITQFAVGANGILTAQQTFFTQGINPFRMVSDGNFLYVLDHDSPSSEACSRALGGSVTSCGDITAFQINQVTGRLQLLQNAQITSASGSPLPYFPVPADSIDFVMSGAAVLTLTGTPATHDTVYVYQKNQATGQLSLVLNGSDSIGDVHHATAIVSAGGYIYVLDNEAPSSNPNGATSQMLPFTVVNYSLQAATSGPIPDDPSLSNPVYAMTDKNSKWLYVANQGNNTQSLPQSGIAGYTLNGSQAPTEVSGSPFGTGSGPQCLVRDTSDQFFYTANFNDSTVTGKKIDARSGLLNLLSPDGKVPNSYKLTGQPTWCLVDGRTN